MPVFLGDRDALEKILAVELKEGSTDWERLDYRDFLLNLRMNNSFIIFKNAWEALTEPEKQNEDFIAVGNNDCIYGRGGWHRYYVKRNGEILFHSAFSYNQEIARAEIEGFTIF
jgi:hypothetical protein